MKLKETLIAALVLLMLAGAAWMVMGRPAGVEPSSIESVGAAPRAAEGDQDLVTSVSERSGRRELDAAAAAEPSQPATLEESSLPPGAGSLEVHVTWRDGTPAEGVALLLKSSGIRRDVAVDRWRATDQHGRAAFPNLEPGKYRVEADRGGDAQGDVKTGETTSTTLELTESYDIHGVVLDPTGRSVPGATVFAAAWRYDWRGAKTVATTGDDGRFVIRSMIDNASGDMFEGRSLGARASGWAPSEYFHLSRVVPSSVGADRVVAVTLTLGERGADVFGTVTGPDGEPIADVMVATEGARLFQEQFEGDQFVAAQKPHVVETDSDGRYALEGLGAGTHRVFAWGPDWPVWSSAVEVVPGVNLRRDIEMVPGTTVFGHVRLRDAQPAAGAIVMALPEYFDDPYPDQGPTDEGSPFPHPRTQADDDGYYELGPVPSGELHLHASLGTSYLTVWTGQEPVYQGTLQETLQGAPGERIQWDPTLSFGFIISGRATYADGTPMGREFVTADDPEGGHFATTTEKDGTFVLSNLKKAPYRVSLQLPFDAPKAASAEVYYDVTPPAEGLLLQADYVREPKAPKGKLRLRVEDQAHLGTRLNKGVIVPVVHYEATASWRVLKADDEGLFEVNLRPGHYRIVLSAQSHVVLHATRVEILSGETLDLGTLKTAPLAALDVTLVRPEGFDAPVKVRPVYYDASRVTVPEAGHVASFADLAPGTIKLEVSGVGIATETRELELLPGVTNTANVPLRLAATTRIECTLAKPRGFRRIELKVTGADGTGWLTRTRRERHVDSWPFVGEVHLVPGRYVVQLETSDGQSGRRELVVEGAGATRTFPIKAH